MYRYIRSSDYFPTSSKILSAQYNNNSRYFFPPPILPYTKGSQLNHKTHFCGSASHIGHVHCTADKECTSTSHNVGGLREHSLKKILPWRSQPELASQANDQIKSQYTGRDVKYIGNSTAIFEPPVHEKFPNLVTESNLLAAHGTTSHTLAGAKYSPKEWNINNRQLCTGAECIHNNVSVVQSDVRQCIAENSKEQIRSHLDTAIDLDKRIGEVEEWTNKLKQELQFNIEQFQKIANLKGKVELVLQNLENPLDISRENLYQRQSRQGVELVHDSVEDCLFREVEEFGRSKNELQGLASQLNAQQNKLRGARHELEMDISNKQYAHGTDSVVRALNETSNVILSKNSQNCSGQFIPHSHSSPSSWLANTQAIIQKSMEERHIAHSLYHQVQEALSKSYNDCSRFWSQTNNSFVTRITEICQAIKTMENHLNKINFDIGQVHSQRLKIQKIIDEKKPALQLAQTRLEKRKERTGLELCRDKVMISLLHEIHILKTAIQELSIQLSNLNQLHEQLICTKSKLENDLKLKKYAYNIDAEKCLKSRRQFCMNKVFDLNN